MEGSREFSCYQSTSLFGRRKDVETLYLKIDNGTLSGRAYVCNDEGKNGYVDDFSFKISEVSTAMIGKYNGTPAFIFNAKITNMYGGKKAQIALPQMRDAEAALDMIMNMKGEGASAPASEKTVASSMAQVPPSAKANTPVAEPEEKPRVQSVAELRNNGSANKHSESIAAASTPAPAAQPEHRVIDEPFVAKPYVAPEPAAPAEDPNKLSTDEFHKRMEKLTVLKDCGLLGEKEFKAKKIELVSEFCDLSEFNEKIQKMIILKDCGVLSEKEFEANRNDIIKECCNLETTDLNEYRQNIQKLSFLEMGDVITAEEFATHTANLIADVDFKIDDTKEAFQIKLRKLPILRDNQVITDADYKKKVTNLFKMIEIKPDEDLSAWAAKLAKWPVLAEERYISQADLRNKQKELVSTCLDTEWDTMEELAAYIDRMIALRDGEWLSMTEFHAKKTELLRKVDSIPTYSAMLQARILLPKVGLITDADYENWKQKIIADIFAPCSDMSQFKGKANNLMELQQAGVITEKEFTEYKMKLMNAL